MSNKKTRIAIIDDDTDIIFYLRSILDKEYESLFFSWNGTQGFYGLKKYVEELNADLFILDVNLPGINGFDVGKKIREYYQREIPIIYMSAGVPVESFFLEDQRNSYFIPKPLKKEHVKIAVQEMI